MVGNENQKNNTGESLKKVKEIGCLRVVMEVYRGERGNIQTIQSMKQQRDSQKNDLPYTDEIRNLVKGFHSGIKHLRSKKSLPIRIKVLKQKNPQGENPRKAMDFP
jgi:hypothetical protein